MQFCSKTVFKSGKDSCSAQKLKEEGNKYFVAGKYQRALDKYNQSLVLAEEGGGPSSLGVVLGNRSAALYHLRQYAACVQDVDTALATSCPAHLELKLLERRARCFCSLGDQRRFLKEIEKIETKHCDDEVWRKKQENLVSELRKLSCKVKDANILNNQQEEVTLLKSRNKDFEGFSDLLEMRYSEDRGRYMVASEDIAVGTVLGAERPICSMLTRQAAETQVCTTLVVYVGTTCEVTYLYLSICFPVQRLLPAPDLLLAAVRRLRPREVLQLGVPRGGGAGTRPRVRPGHGPGARAGPGAGGGRGGGARVLQAGAARPGRPRGGGGGGAGGRGGAASSGRAEGGQHGQHAQSSQVCNFYIY